MDAAIEDHPKIVAFPPLLWLISALVSVLIHFLVFSIPILPEPFALILGIVCLLAGPSLAVPALLSMRAAGTHANPAKPALLIVRGGPYRFTRNPMYLALCLVQAGIGFLLNDWVTLLFVVPLALVLHFGVILPEERYLEAKFGEEYLALKRKVRRWI
jgi:protein-S-isoprenylcysteine O-methyltransferase Ste14